MAWNTEQRPGQAVYRQDYENKGKYKSSQGRPYINPDIPMFVPKDGSNCVRIVDPIELNELKAYYLEVFMHRDVGLKGDYFTCPKEMGRWNCPLCEQRTRDLWEQDEDKWKSFLPSRRRLLWVLDLNDPKERDVLKLWSCPTTLHEEILTQSKDMERDVFKDVSHPITGVKIYFDRTGKGRNTKYTGVKLGAEYPLGEEIDAQRVYRFRENVVLWAPYEEIKASMEFQDTSTDGAGSEGSFDRDSWDDPDESERGTEQTSGSSTPDDGEFDLSDLERINQSNLDCFRVQFDQYQDCEACADKALCCLPWPLKKNKPTKTEKPKDQGKTPKPGKTTTQGGGTSSGYVRTSESTSNALNEDLKSSQTLDRVAAAKAALAERLKQRK